jgi:hypothetical protein
VEHREPRRSKQNALPRGQSGSGAINVRKETHDEARAKTVLCLQPISVAVGVCFEWASGRLLQQQEEPRERGSV